MKKCEAALVLCVLVLPVSAGCCQQLLWTFTNDVPQASFSGSPAVADDGTDLLNWATWTDYVSSNAVMHFTDSTATNLDKRF